MNKSKTVNNSIAVAIATGTAARPRKSKATRIMAYCLIYSVGLQPLVAAAAPAPAPTPAPLMNLFNGPPSAGNAVPPYVMIAASKDQQLFKKAYDDFSDLDGDGNIETTYKHSIDYYGYFDSGKCYVYSDANKRYEPSSITTNKYCSGDWSGNFLNWASMTRIDALRKVLYGGNRSATRSSSVGGDAAGLNDGDAVNSTVLERSFLPHDAHSFAKYYDGDDLNQLTPFTTGANIVTNAPAISVDTYSSVTTTVASVVDVVTYETTTTPPDQTKSKKFTRSKATSCVQPFPSSNVCTFATPLFPAPGVSGVSDVKCGNNNGNATSVTLNNSSCDVTWTESYLPVTTSSNTQTPGSVAVHTPTTVYNDVTTVQLVSSIAAQTQISSNDRRVTVGSTKVFEVGDIVELRATPGNYVRGTISAKGGAGAATYIDVTGITPINMGGTVGSATWTVANLSRRGITICNTTNGASSGIQASSNTNTNLPRMKIARGNHSLWNASERWQCTWSGDHATYNGNNFGLSGVPASGNSPNQNLGLDVPGKGNAAGQGDYFVRVQACVSGLIGGERCKQYINGQYKPVGLLQVFGETDRIRFGLMTGSYTKNLSGGVLRKNVGKLDDEINLATGQFKDLSTNGYNVAARVSDADGSTLAGGSIIKNLSTFRMTGYEYGNGNYFGGVSDDSCSYQVTLDVEGRCKSWGNPMSELYYETLRYFAGETGANAKFVTDDSSAIAGLSVATWPGNTAVLSEKNYCAPLNALVINAATLTNENDDDRPALDVSFMDGSPPSVTVLTDKVGDILGVTGKQAFMGSRLGDASTSPGFNACTGKEITGLGKVLGICPEGPTTNGSYLMAGMAHHAHTNRIRKDFNNNAKVTAGSVNLKRAPFQLETYGVSLSAGVPRIPIKYAGDTSPRATLQPSYRLDLGGVKMGGALVDLRVLAQVETADRAYGRVMAIFEDSEGGGDYDMDVWGTYTYELTKAKAGTFSQPAVPERLSITTDAIFQATANPQGFGYIISGTNKDGQHFHSGILGFSYNDPISGMAVTGTAGRINSSGGCNGCQVDDGPSTATYSLSSTALAISLEEPLYYTALFGGFDDANGDKKPVIDAPSAGVFPVTEYDKRNNATGAEGPDGIPDNYFKVSNPLGLEVSLERTFQQISEQSSLTAVSSSSTRVKAGNKIYEAQFNSGDWSGDLEARESTATGKLGAPIWKSSSFLGVNTDQDTRTIISMASDTRGGVPFRWANITAAQQGQLSLQADGSTDALGAARLKYIRGDGTKEGNGAAQFRKRFQTKLGDIVDSNPVYVGKPSGGFLDTTYTSFAASNRTPVVYVGANDGMLHGFNANDGKEVLAYVPSKVYDKLSTITRQDYNHVFTVNGQIATQDVKEGSNWKTYLVGALGKGGQGVYSLDVTDPSNFTEANAASIVKWEFTDADDADLGYVYSDPVIRKMPNGKWAALITSGYNAGEPDGRASTTGKPYLFILYMNGPTGAGKTWVSGTDYLKIEIPVGSPSDPVALGGVSTWDVEADGTTDYAYAGDQKGNMWRIQLSNNTVFKLFTATSGASAQIISEAPRLADGPGYEGVMVMFGTGQLVSPQDLLSSSFVTQTIYGLLDKFSSVQIDTADLMEQQFVATTSATTGIYSLLTRYIPNYTSATRTNIVYGPTKPFATGPTSSTAPQRGWKLHAPNSATTGERSIYKPVVSGALLVVANAIPNFEDPCAGGGSQALYVVDIYSGGRGLTGGLDKNADGALDTLDMSTFGLNATNGTPSTDKFYASVRVSTGGYGQVTVLAGGTAGTGSPNDPPGAKSQSCSRALAYSSIKDQADVLPGGCASRLQWREAL